MRERWEGRWPAALPGGAPTGAGAGPARIDGTRGFAVLAFADELIDDPSLLAAYASRFGPNDDATLVIAMPEGTSGVEQELGRALVAAGIDERICPDLTAVSVPDAPAAHAHLAGAVDAIFTRRDPGAPFRRLPRYDTDGMEGLRSRALAA